MKSELVEPIIRKFLAFLEEKKDFYPNRKIICHSDADGICAAILALDFFPTATIEPHEHFELPTFPMSHDTLYLFIDIQPKCGREGPNTFCIDHHFLIKKGLNKGVLQQYIIIDDLLKSGQYGEYETPDSNTFLIEYISYLYHGGTGEFQEFIEALRTAPEYKKGGERYLQFKLLLCGVLCDNPHYMYEDSSPLDDLTKFSKRKLNKLRELSIALSIAVAELDVKKREKNVNHIISTFKKELVSGHRSKELVLDEHREICKKILAFNDRLIDSALQNIAKKKRDRIFIYLNTPQMINQVKGILTTYFYTKILALKEAKTRVILLENRGNTIATWSGRTYHFHTSLRFFKKIFENWERLKDGGRFGAYGGAMTVKKPSLDNWPTFDDLGKIQKTGWGFMIVNGDILKEPETYAGFKEISEFLPE